MSEQVTFKETFEAAERARIMGDNKIAVELYAKAAAVVDENPVVNEVDLHHMWGVALISLGRTEEARRHLRRAATMKPNQRHWAVIDRDLARSYYYENNLEIALIDIDRSLSYIPLDDIAERGASLGFKACILLAITQTEEALEIFGTADTLLQRSDNRHYELYNLLHFLEALLEHQLHPRAKAGERDFIQFQIPRLQALVEIFGGPPYQKRADKITADILADI